MSRRELTDSEKLRLLKRRLLQSLSCYYSMHRCTHPEQRAAKEIAELLGEPFQFPELDAEARWLAGNQ